MRLVALLSFYDEDPATLHRMIESLPVAGVTHLVACDGAYAAFPGATGHSAPEQIDAIKAACCEAIITLTLEQPNSPWAGNEIEKRTRLFEIAETVTTPEDWYAVVDADEEIVQAPQSLHNRLRATHRDVGTVFFDHPGQPETMPRFFRALRGLHVTGNHYTYRTPDRRNLWGDENLEPAEPLLDVTIRHHFKERDPLRRVQRVAYYQQRDRLGLET